MNGSAIDCAFDFSFEGETEAHRRANEDAASKARRFAEACLGVTLELAEGDAPGTVALVDLDQQDLVLAILLAERKQGVLIRISL